MPYWPTQKNRQKSMFYETPEHPEIAVNVDFTSVKNARSGAAKLKQMFKKAKSKKRKLIILKATQLAANRARAMLKKKDLKPETRQRLKRVAEIYEVASDWMQKEYEKIK